MTREELKAHCLDQIEMCKTWAVGKGEKPSGKIYEEHKLILELLEQEPRWIPVSERLPEHPENNDYYLVTIQCEHYDGWDDYVTGFAEWTEHGWDELSCYIGQIKVIAWMPLLEPYREVEE